VFFFFFGGMRVWGGRISWRLIWGCDRSTVYTNLERPSNPRCRRKRSRDRHYPETKTKILEALNLGEFRVNKMSLGQRSNLPINNL